ncbi:MAG TPA: peptidylprolyl isomerase [Steroidobacteraceae bacterium]|nr:peptidylprolyl isomerase [Steroidobacteraceae bacterium]
MTLNLPRLLLAAALGLQLTACAPKASAPADTSPPVATVNGKPISRDLYEFYVKNVSGKTSAELTPDIRDKLLDNMVRGEVIAQEAVRQGLDKSGDTAYILELSRLNVLGQAVGDHYLKDKKPTEPELRADYDAYVAAAPKTEYHARHILVATEPFAEKVIQRLGRGEKFEDLARVESMDPSKSNGGDLSWIRPESVPPEFMKALESLKPGEYTKTPVQTSFGWHIVQLVETRPLAPQAYEQRKPRIEQEIERKKFKDYIDELMRTAQVKKMLDQGAPAAAALAPASPASPVSPAPVPPATPAPAPAPAAAPKN